MPLVAGRLVIVTRKTRHLALRQIFRQRKQF